MATKWKNRIALITFVLLFTLGLRGLLTGISDGSEYLKRDYFQTKQFESQLNQFIDYLSMFDLNYINKEELKKEITVTAEEIDEHRYRYGDLTQQIADIKAQYEDRIRYAEENNNKEAADVYIAEREKKIEDITNNFTSDEYVRVKIVKEKEEKVDEYYRELERYRPEYTKLRTGFKYYLKDTVTGEVYTNLNVVNEAEVAKVINSSNMRIIRSYPTAQNGYLSIDRANNYFGNGQLIGNLILQGERLFEGKIAVPRSVSASSLIQLNYRDYQQRQKFYWIYTLGSLGALLLSLYLYKRTAVWQLLEEENWQAYYNRLPLDLGVVGFGFTAFVTLLQLTTNNGLYSYAYLPGFIRDTIFEVIFTGLFLALTVMQGKLLLARVKDWESFKIDWQKGIIYKSYQGVKEAFLIRSIGTQVLIILMIVFAFGAGAVVVLIAPQVILLYAPLFLVIGLPLLIAILRRIGYFNHIVTNTSGMVRGNLEPDLPVKGRSALATLANNINTLKHGVKISQREQAKSERLKTELITNVSHDLRTPLTSIINYTELLKTPDLTEEDREAYIQIIDRKSKRLKVLIDDLFEASKMASGSIELVKEKVDLVQLLQQALAEYNETISESTLQFRVTKPDQPVYAIVDGQKIWRVFDNLIGNILKYALENTRVYISVQALPGKAVIIFKNVAKYELGQDLDELFERFKRGDTSRHTEGSGLGLAIAKSIIDLHEGSLDIEVDGDLFKITVSLDTSVN